MAVRIEITVKWRAVAIFTMKTFLSLMLILCIYALIKRDGSILSAGDIINNASYILLIYIFMNFVGIFASRLIKLSLSK